MATEDSPAPATAKSSASEAAASPTKAAKPAPAAAPAKRTSEAPAAAEPAPISKIRRRIIWSCVWAYLLGNFLMFLRFFFPRTLFEPPTVFRIGYPSDFSLGVNEKYKQLARIWVIREPTKLYVIYARCVHLGCTPDWKPNDNKFKCPCHGSGYTPEGINFEGPAPRPMDRAHVELAPDGQIVVDTSKLYMWDRAKGGQDEFLEAGAYIKLA